MAEDLKYGWRRGGKVSVPVYMLGSDAYKHQSGKFVFIDSNGRADRSVDGSTRIFGSVEVGEETPAQDDRLNCNISLDAIYRIPVNSGTFAKGMIGDTCDISVSSDIQGAQLDASTEDTLIIVDGDLDNNNWVEVRLNPAKIGTGSGADA